MDTVLEFRRYWRVLYSWAWLIILGALLAGSANYYLTSKMPARYEARTTLMVGQVMRQSNPDQQEIGLIDRLASYYLDLVQRKVVLEGVKQELSLDLPNEKLAAMLSQRIVPSTALIELLVTDTDPQQAVQLANAFAKELIKQSPAVSENKSKEQQDFAQKQLSDLQTKIETGRKDLETLNQNLSSPGASAAEIAYISSQIKALQAQIDGWQNNYISLLKSEGTTAPNSISVLEEASQAHRIETLSLSISVIIAGTAGALLALGFAILMEYLDGRIKTIEEIQARLKLVVLGYVSQADPKGRKMKRKETTNSGAKDRETILTKLQSNPEVNQDYDIISMNLHSSDAFKQGQRSLLLTAPNQLKQQTFVAGNLAAVMVSFEQSVLLVDANTKQPELHELLGVRNQPGFYETFYENDPLDLSKVVKTAIPNLYLMPAGFDTSESGVAKISILHPGAQGIYKLPHHALPGDFVIFNCTSILQDRTTRLLTSHVTGTVLLCELKRTKRQELQEAVEVVKRLKGNILGVIIVEPNKRRLGLLPQKEKPTITVAKLPVEITAINGVEGTTEPISTKALKEPILINTQVVGSNQTDISDETILLHGLRSTNSFKKAKTSVMPKISMTANFDKDNEQELITKVELHQESQVTEIARVDERNSKPNGIKDGLRSKEAEAIQYNYVSDDFFEVPKS